MSTKQQPGARHARAIDWSSAEMREGALKLQLTGDAVKGWGKDFAGVLALLEKSSHGWGEIRLSKQAIEVADVQPGAEEALRHFLESVVLQVNSDLDLDDAEVAGADGGEPEKESEQESREVADRGMTTVFRAFADEDR